MKILILLLLPILCHAQYRTSYHVLEGTYLSLQVADIATTYHALNHGAYEANPVMRWTIDNHIFIPGKIVVAGGVLWMCRKVYTDAPRLAYIYLIVANLFYSAVVLNNYQVGVRLRIAN